MLQTMEHKIMDLVCFIEFHAVVAVSDRNSVYSPRFEFCCACCDEEGTQSYHSQVRRSFKRRLFLQIF